MTIEAPLQIAGLDLGTVRCGLAVGDAQSRIALPLAVVPTQPLDSLAQRIGQCLAGRRIQALVAGLPLDLRGAESESARWITELANRIASELALPVMFVDERFTSKLNQPLYPSGKRKSARLVPNLDALAAAAILQSYLDGLPRSQA